MFFTKARKINFSTFLQGKSSRSLIFRRTLFCSKYDFQKLNYYKIWDLLQIMFLLLSLCKDFLFKTWPVAKFLIQGLTWCKNFQLKNTDFFQKNLFVKKVLLEKGGRVQNLTFLESESSRNVIFWKQNFSQNLIFWRYFQLKLSQVLNF